jgi:hypothetical protein
MFSAWNASDWLNSVVAVTSMFGVVVAFSAFVGYLIIRTWGQEMGAWRQGGFMERKTGTEPPTRRAA